MICGNTLHVSGQLPIVAGEVTVTGAVPSAVTLEAAQGAARTCVLNALSAIDAALDGDWSRFVRVVRVGVYVNSDAGFASQHLVANGASELLVGVFGDVGRHARAAVGMAALPLNAAVEIEIAAEVR